MITLDRLDRLFNAYQRRYDSCPTFTDRMFTLNMLCMLARSGQDPVLLLAMLRGGCFAAAIQPDQHLYGLYCQAERLIQRLFPASIM